MIGDGGAERMVRKRKPEWWMILALVIMFLFIGVVFMFFFFISNGERMIEVLNKSTVKDAYNILTDVKEKYPDLAVTEYEQTDDSVRIEFKYYDTILEKDIDLLSYSYEVKSYMEKYLKDHPEDFINTGKRKVYLRFPNAAYTNVKPEDDFSYSCSFPYASYRFSDITAGDFLKDISFLRAAEVLTFESGDKQAFFGTETDFSGIKNIEGLECLIIEKTDLSKENTEKLKELCDSLGITLKIKEE